MKKFIALMLSLMLLIGCVGSAEIEQGSLNVTFMGQELVDATIAHGIDADGCETVSVDAAAMGQVISAMAQQTDTWYTVKAGDTAYTFTIQNVAKAISLIAGQIESAVGVNVLPDSLGQALPIIMAYNEDEVRLYESAAVNEVNRLMVICQQLNVVSISEDGTLTVQADIDSLAAVAAEYLSELAADETVLPTLAATGMWSAAGLPDAATTAEYLNAIAAQFSGITAETLGATGNLYLVVESTGAMSGEFTVGLGESYVSAQFGYSAEAMNIALDINVMGNTASYNYVVSYGHISCYESVNGTTYSYTYDLGEDGTTMNIGCTLVNEEMGLNVAETGTVNLADYSVNLTETVNGVNYYVTGALAQFVNGYEYTLTVTDDAANSQYYKAGITSNVYADGSCDYNAYLDMNGTMCLAKLTVNGTDYTATISVNDTVLYTLQCGWQLIDENNATAYVVYNGMKFVATAAKTDTDALLSIDYGFASEDETADTEYANLLTATVSKIDDNNVYVTVTYQGMTLSGNVHYSAEEQDAYANLALSYDVTYADGSTETYTMDLINCGIKVVADNQIMVYAVYDGVEYDLTLTQTQYANGIGLNGSLDMVISYTDSDGAEQTYAQNIGTMDATYAITDGEFAHIEGTEVSGEDLAALFMNVVSMFVSPIAIAE